MSNSESTAEDYSAFISGEAYVPLSDWSTITMTGEDRVSFLQNMCSNDIKHLAVGDSCEAFCTDVKGKIIAHVFVVAREDRLVLLSTPEQAEKIVAHLDRYIVREDVQLTDETETYTWFVAAGDGVPEDLAELDPLIHSGAFSEATIVGCSGDDANQKLLGLGLRACQPETLDVLRVESFLPLFGVDFDSTNLPQEVNRDSAAISFNKGCYLGQETVARIDALGHVNQKLVALSFTGENVPKIGSELQSEDKVVGHVTSSCWSPREQRPLALAMVRRGSNDAGTALESEHGSATILPSS